MMEVEIDATTNHTHTHTRNGQFTQTGINFDSKMTFENWPYLISPFYIYCT